MGLLSNIILVILTIMAWRRGWRWWALLPAGILMFLVVFIALMVGTVMTLLAEPLEKKIGLEMIIIYANYMAWFTCVPLIVMIVKERRKRDGKSKGHSISTKEEAEESHQEH